MTTSRRQLMMAAAATLLRRAAIAADEANQSRMIVRSARPEDLEMPLDGFSEFITPIDRFFVRCHTYTPKVEIAVWKLKIDGLVDNPVTLTLEDLKKLPRVELVGVLECAGSGRSFYRPTVAGTQWTYGGVGNGRWAGVRLRDVLQKAGVKSSAKNILCDGADVPLGKMPDFQRTIEIEKALHPDTLLAYEMNGQTLPVEHGFPLRVIVPGWAGDSWVKWLQHIEVLDHDFDGFWMKTAYRHPERHVEPGTAVDAKEMVPVTDIGVKSVIASPSAWAQPGRVRIKGTAWSNGARVTKVNISVDGGTTWNNAKLFGQETKYGWRAWQYDWKASEGEQTIIARATDSSGRTQPLAEEWNPSGYLWNVAQPRKITVSERRIETSSAAAPEPGQFPDGYKSTCLGCHDEHMMTQQHLTQAQWGREIDKMAGWGAQVNSQNREAILKYLAEHFKP